MKRTLSRTVVNYASCGFRALARGLERLAVAQQHRARRAHRTVNANVKLHRMAVVVAAREPRTVEVEPTIPLSVRLGVQLRHSEVAANHQDMLEPHAVDGVQRSHSRRAARGQRL